MTKPQFTAGDLNEVAAEEANGPEDVVNGRLLAFGEGIFGVAIGAADVAVGQSNEDAGESGPGGFPLNTMENLMDYECSGCGMDKGAVHVSNLD